jgi:hemolysin activation/secretion protein
VSLSNNISGFGDTLAVAPILDRYAKGAVIHYELPINRFGTRFKVDSSIVRGYPKNDIYQNDQYNFLGKGWTLGVGLSQPLIRRPNWRLTGDITTEIQQVSTLARKSPIGRLQVEQENLRDIRMGLQLDHTGDYGSTMLRHELTQGLDILGASPNTSKKLPVSGGGTQYTRYIGTLAFEKSLPLGTSAVLNAQFQYSANKLPSFQQYGAGGTFTGRGYKEVYLPGDTALFVSGQYNFPAAFIPKHWKYPFKEESIRDSLQFLVFTDYTWVKLNDRFAGADPTEILLSAGIGARLQVSKNVTARVDLGVPILRNAPFHQNPRVHFGLIGALF